MELIWEGKYEGNVIGGKRVAPVRIALPFQDVETVNESVQERQRGFDLFSTGRPRDWRNRLIWGDKKYVLPSLLPEFAGQVKLIYIDPPFATGDNFSFSVEVEGEDFTKNANAIEQKAYRDIWGQGLDSYAKWFYETVVLLYDLLAEDGSIYVHCDYRVDGVVRNILDEVFGTDNFLNEVIWLSAVGDTSAKNKKFIKSHDMILVYTKSMTMHTWNDVFQEYSEASNKLYKYQDEQGLYRLAPVDNPGGGGYVYDLGFGELRPSNGYRMPKETAVEWLEQGILILERGKVPSRKLYRNEDGVRCRDIWTDISGSVAKEYATQKPEALLERIIKASSNEGDLVLDCFSGSGTTATVAERLGRRWITADFGRFAIHTTRKRLLGIPNVRPFVVQNLGKYERQLWQQAEFGDSAAVRQQAYTNFILSLYHATPVNGYSYLQGVKDGRMVQIGAVDAPITTADVDRAITEWQRNIGQLGASAGQRVSNGIDFLGWEFAFELNEVKKQEAAASNIDVRFLSIPREVLEKKAVEQGDIQFFELAALDVATAVKGRVLTLLLNNFTIPPNSVPAEVRASVGSKWEAWIDYWAVDWDFKGDTFHNQWQNYRTKKSNQIQRQASHEYERPGHYVVQIKVIDILGNDTTRTIEVEVK